LLRERAVENAALVEKAYANHDHHSDDGDDGEVWMGISLNTREPKQFEDEEHLATVTVVEDFDPDTLIHGPIECDPNRSRQPGKSRAKSLGSEFDKGRSKKVRYPTNGIRRGSNKKQD
jgi:ribosomal RNA-processing protein 17